MYRDIFSNIRNSRTVVKLYPLNLIPKLPIGICILHQMKHSQPNIFGIISR